MKKRFFSIVMQSMLFAATLFSFTACGKDDEPGGDDKFTTEYTFSAEFSSDLLKTAEVKVYLFTPDGSLTEETVTKEKNTWTFKGNVIPDKAGLMFEFDARQNIPQKDYRIKYNTSTTVKCIKNEEVFSYKNESSEDSFTVAAEQISNFYGTSLTLGGEVDSKGEARVTNGSNIDFGLNSSIPRPPFGGSGRW